MPKILLFANTDWYLYNFRLSLAKNLRDQGHEVILLSPPGNFQKLLQENGFQLISFPFSRQGINPFYEIWTLWQLIRVYRKVQPDIVHHFTIKPVIYGSLAAHFRHIGGIINSITGLGHLFIDPGPITRLLRIVAKWLYRISLRDTQVIFENPEDRNIFIKNHLLKAERAHLIMGTGVDVEKFRPTNKNNDIPVVLFSSRMLATKGVLEYMDAVRILKQNGSKARFALAGTTDLGNPASVTDRQIASWNQSGLVEWWGWQEDMPNTLAQTDIFCLPSYREGVPNALIEASACGLPIVTTDVPGCRDVVTHGVNGLLVPVKNAVALANALKTLLTSPDMRQRMGIAGRETAIKKFSTTIVNAETLSVYKILLSASPFGRIGAG
ncbi:MAG TPA: glycosyltransferase family 4 protein [Anaerolineales bacterium]|nr:glycosyltransferase family 4 protein [Anaerolineales bacterium]